MYCTVFFIIVARFSFLSRPEVSFSRESRVFVLFFSCEEEFWSSTVFYGLFCCVCSPCIPSWFSLPAVVRAAAPASRMARFSQQPNWSSVFLWRAPSATQSRGHWEAQTDIISDCEAFVSSVVAVVCLVFVLCETCACIDAFFFLHWIVLFWALRCFSASLIFMPYANLLNSKCHFPVDWQYKSTE